MENIALEHNVSRDFASDSPNPMGEYLIFKRPTIEIAFLETRKYFRNLIRKEFRVPEFAEFEREQRFSGILRDLAVIDEA